MEAMRATPLLIVAATLAAIVTPPAAAAEPASLGAPVPQWVWAPSTTPTTAPDQPVRFRRALDLEKNPRTAVLKAAVTGRATIYVNGEQATVVQGYEAAQSIELSRYFKGGRNVIAVEAEPA